MKRIDCDSHLGIIDFDDGESWKNIPDTEFHRLMEILLPKSVIDRYTETDYRGVISQIRYDAGKKYYKEICSTFRIKDTSKE